MPIIKYTFISINDKYVSITLIESGESRRIVTMSKISDVRWYTDR